MKKIFTLLLLLSLLAAPSLAVDLNEWNIRVNINDDRTADFIARLEYNGTVTKSDYFIAAPITDVQVSADGGRISCDTNKREIGTEIACQMPGGASSIEYRFKAFTLVDEFGTFKRFGYKFPVIENTNKLVVRLIMPLRAVTASEDSLKGSGLNPIEPELGRQGSDGRNIFIEWIKNEPKLGSSLDISVIFEKEGGELNLDIISIVAGVVVIIALLLFFKTRDIKNVLPVLTNEERKLIELLIKERKPIEQKRLAKELDCSKSKIARIVKDLEERGLLKKIPKGRTNKIKLVHNYTKAKEIKDEDKKMEL